MMEFRKATIGDGIAVLERLRPEQKATLEKLELDAMVLLNKVVDNGMPSTTVLIDGEVAAVFGVARETLLGEVKIWMITTDLIEKHPIEFLRNSRRFTKSLFSAYGPLVGMVDSDFEKSRRWLRWIGFEEVRKGDFIVMRYSGGH